MYSLAYPFPQDFPKREGIQALCNFLLKNYESMKENTTSPKNFTSLLVEYAFRQESREICSASTLLAVY